VRQVELADGRTYTHRCSLETLKEVAWHVEEHAKEGVTTGELWDAFQTRGRRSYPASDILFEEAMIEFHALEAE
jgi:hypothetical protein